MALKNLLSNYVINSSELFALKENKRIKIIDARWFLNDPHKGKKEYKKSHLEGATFFDLEKLSDNSMNLPHMIPEKDKFTNFAKKNGLNYEHQIIIYDQEGFFSSTRVWFTFMFFGFKKIKILNGGIKKWKELRLPTTSIIKKINASNFYPKNIASDNIIRKKELERILINKKSNIKIIDARPENRYLGNVEEPRPNLRKGNIKFSVNIPFDSIIDNNSSIKKFGQLENLIFTKNKIEKNNTIICYCGSGVTACNIIFALNILGCKNVKLYDGSWAEWGKTKLSQN